MRVDEGREALHSIGRRWVEVPRCKQRNESCSGIPRCCDKLRCFWEDGFNPFQVIFTSHSSTSDHSQNPSHLHFLNSPLSCYGQKYRSFPSCIFPIFVIAKTGSFSLSILVISFHSQSPGLLNFVFLFFLL